MSGLRIPSRFQGPPRSGNGGWTAGAIAELTGLHGAVEVTLRRPPPLDTFLATGWEGDRLVANDDGAVVAEARAAEVTLTPVAPVDPQTAATAESDYPGLRHHPFPTCFSCGTERARGDGLRIFPGPVGEGLAAATWTPHPSHGDGHRATVPVTWAALDCVGAWSSDLESRPLVLGRITAVIHALPRVGSRHVVVGAVRLEDGRKVHTASSLFSASGELLAQAEHTWFAIDPADFS